MLFDYHMHSNFSADSETPMEEMIQSSINKGLTEICFTEHIDYEYPDPTISFDLDIPAYTQELNRMREKYKDIITIKKGVELGVQPYLLERYETLMKAEDFDFVICSIHTADKKDLHSGDFFANRTPEDAYQLYYEELLYCVKNFKQYNILGHIDLVKRYKALDSKENFHDILSEIFKVIIPDGKGIELNASGYAYGLGGPMPSKDILELYKECGGEIVTIGSDAHVPHHVGYNFTEIIELIKSTGFKYITTFDQMKPSFHPISKLNKIQKVSEI